MEYAYAVARIRANETRLFTKNDIEQLISADYSVAVRILSDKGWSVPESFNDFDVAEKELEKAWELIVESVPDSSLLEALVVSNDFFNLKVAIKCIFSNIDPNKYYVFPNITDTKIITESIRNANFSMLPVHLLECAKRAYEAISKFESGQLAESILDKSAIETKINFARKSESSLLMKIANFLAVSANIKIALRCRKMGKSENFALESMCACGISNKELFENADDNSKMAEYIEKTEYSFLSDSIKKGFSSFEKKCDNNIISWLESTKYEIFGPNPIVAYYYAKQIETKNVRIILSAKASGISDEIITKRVRNIYV